MSWNEKHGFGTSLRPGLFNLLTAALVLWPVALLYRNTFSVSPLSLVEQVVAALPLTPIGDWCLRVLPIALPVLSLILITLAFLRN